MTVIVGGIKRNYDNSGSQSKVEKSYDSQKSDTNGIQYEYYSNGIRLSEDKLKDLLSKMYEKSHKDTKYKGFWSHYSAFFSICGTLVVSLISTAQYNGFGGMSEAIIKAIVIGLVFVSGIFGFIGFLRCKNEKNYEERRDIAVKESLEELKECSSVNK